MPCRSTSTNSVWAEAVGEPKVRKTRAPNGRSSIYEGKDGSWHGRVTVGLKEDGRPDRRHVQAKSRADVTRKVRALERERDTGRVRPAASRRSVQDWLTYWLENIVSQTARFKTLEGYGTDIRVHLVPGIGAHWLDKLQPEHLEKMYARMTAAGSSSGTVNHVHRTLRSALSEAVRRGHVPVNVAKIARPPRVENKEIRPFTVVEARRLIEIATPRRNGVRWVVALSLGLRQAEVIGLRWEHVDLTRGVLRVKETVHRRTWQHGCGGGCGRKRGAECPQRHSGGLLPDEVKSRAGNRTIALPAPVLELLLAHREAQRGEAQMAGSVWSESGYVFTGPTGKPLDPSGDSRAWKVLLTEAGLRSARLHDARHTAATMLLVLGVNQRSVMGIMGWSSVNMTQRYQHIIPEILDDIASQVGGLLWSEQPGVDSGSKPPDGA
jgi:integrase